MEDQEFINQLAEKLSKLGTVRPLGFHYLHPYGTVPADSIICNGATYSRALYKDFFDYITTQGWVKTEAEWQKIATRDNGFCPFYSDGDGSTNFRTPKFAPYQQIAMEVAKTTTTTTYHQARLPNITGRIYDKSEINSPAWTINPERTAVSGAFRIGGEGGKTAAGTSKGYEYAKDFNFDASRSNTIYGASNTVQPESHEWVMCVVAYGVATNIGSVDIQNVMAAVNAVQASIAEVEGNLSSIVKFTAPDYSAKSYINANTSTTMQANGFIRYFIRLAGTGGKARQITINDTQLTVNADNYSIDRGIFPVIKGDTVKHNGVDEVVFFPARYAS